MKQSPSPPSFSSEEALLAFGWGLPLTLSERAFIQVWKCPAFPFTLRCTPAGIRVNPYCLRVWPVHNLPLCRCLGANDFPQQSCLSAGSPQWFLAPLNLSQLAAPLRKLTSFRPNTRSRKSRKSICTTNTHIRMSLPASIHTRRQIQILVPTIKVAKRSHLHSRPPKRYRFFLLLTF